MSEQQITAELRRWIVEQASAGHTPESVLQAMRASGWNEDVAVNALEVVLRSHLDRQGHAANASEGVRLPEADAANAPDAVPLPDPAHADGVVTVHAGDRDVQVLMSLRQPRVVVLGGLLSDDECDELVALARERLERSQTVVLSTGGSEVNASRTSEGMFFGREENPLCARIEARIAALVGWPLDHGEGLQILHYGPSAEYKPHYDYFDPAQPGTPAILKRGGQRVATLVTYLNTPARGGSTVFPDVQLDVAPVKGNAVFFSYDRPHPSTRTLHGGAPVIEGEKWVATKWLRQGRFE